MASGVGPLEAQIAEMARSLSQLGLAGLAVPAEPAEPGTRSPSAASTAATGWDFGPLSQLYSAQAWPPDAEGAGDQRGSAPQLPAGWPVGFHAPPLPPPADAPRSLWQPSGSPRSAAYSYDPPGGRGGAGYYPGAEWGPPLPGAFVQPPAAWGQQQGQGQQGWSGSQGRSHGSGSASRNGRWAGDYSAGDGYYSGGSGGGGSGEYGQGWSEHDTPQSSPLLEDFRAGRFMPRSVDDLRGGTADFAVDQAGCAVLERIFDTGGVVEREQLFWELLHCALSLMTDVTGCKILARYLEIGTTEQKYALAGVMKDQVLRLSLHPVGCRVVQKAITGLPHEGRVQLAMELSRHVLKCVEDSNANFVIQCICTHVRTDALGFVLSSFVGNMMRVATHVYGCRVTQRIIEAWKRGHCRDEALHALVLEALDHTAELCVDVMGNHVVQQILTIIAKPELRAHIIATVLHVGVLGLSMHKYASNIVERCLEFGSTSEKHAIVEEIMGPTVAAFHAAGRVLPDPSGANGVPLTPLQLLLANSVGNYVAQQLIDSADDQQRADIIEILRSYAPVLRSLPWGGKLLVRLDRLAAASIRAVEPGQSGLPAYAHEATGAPQLVVPAGMPRNSSTGSLRGSSSRSGSHNHLPSLLTSSPSLSRVNSHAGAGSSESMVSQASTLRSSSSSGNLQQQQQSRHGSPVMGPRGSPVMGSRGWKRLAEQPPDTRPLPTP